MFGLVCFGIGTDNLIPSSSCPPPPSCHSRQGTTHIVLDEVHERSIEIDLLLLLLRDVLERRRQKAATAAAAGQQQQQQQLQLQPLKLVLMSATADAQLFAEYMTPGAGGRGGARGGKAKAAGGGGGGGGEVGMMTIPGFTYPVREFYLEVS